MHEALQTDSVLERELSSPDIVLTHLHSLCDGRLILLKYRDHVRKKEYIIIIAHAQTHTHARARARAEKEVHALSRYSVLHTKKDLNRCHISV